VRIFTIGETTYDILFRNGQPVNSCSGGSAFNSAISLGRCGLPVRLITTFGNDPIGDLSYDFLLRNGVNCDLVKRFEGQSRIALAFIGSGNNAEYSFYQASRDVFPDYPVPETNDIVLLGSSFALRDNGREELLRFLEEAQNRGCITIYDPNARQPMTGQTDNLLKIQQNIALATIIKGSDQDFLNIFGVDNGQNAYSLIRELGPGILVYTKGAEGAELFSDNLHLKVPAKKTKVLSTIGAGDNFSAGIVYGLTQQITGTISDLRSPDWEEILEFGTLFASEVCGSSENYLSVEKGRSLHPGSTDTQSTDF
jgi:fructokinase